MRPTRMRVGISPTGIPWGHFANVVMETAGRNEHTALPFGEPFAKQVVEMGGRHQAADTGHCNGSPHPGSTASQGPGDEAAPDLQPQDGGTTLLVLLSTFLIMCLWGLEHSSCSINGHGLDE